MLWKKQPVGSKIADLNSDITKLNGGTLYADNINPNDYRTTGFYSVGIAAAYSPTGSTIYGILEVINNGGNSGVVKQLFYRGDNNTYERFKPTNTETWTAWISLNDKTDTSVIGSSPIPINANTDLNTIITPGYYVCAYNADVTTLTNCPVSVAFTMQVLRGTVDGNAIQIITDYYGGYTYKRIKHSTTWESWISLDSNIANLQGGKLGNLQQVSGVAVNTIRDSGFYYLSNCSGLPYGSYGYLQVYKRLDGYVKQIFQPIDLNRLYTNTYYNSTWVGWEEFAGKRRSIVTSITVHQNLTTKRLHAYRCGKIVWIDGEFQVTGDIPNGQALLSNLPTSAISNTDSTTFLCPVRGGEWSATPTKWHFQLIADTRIINGTTTLTSGDYIDIQRTYIADD